MKKFVTKTAAVWILLICLLLSACGTDTPNEKDPGSATTAAGNTATAAPTREPTAEPTAAPTEEPTPEPTLNTEIASGINVALNCKAVTSSTTGEVHELWGWKESYINDGITENLGAEHVGWTTAVQVNFDDPEQEEWVELTLDSIVMINKVVIYPIGGAASFFPINYHIEISEDGKTFTTVGEVEGDTHCRDRDDSPVTIEFEAAAARVVRFVATKLYDFELEGGTVGQDGYLCQLAEIEVYTA